MKPYKLAIVAPVPFYYHVPFYQKLSKSDEIDLAVFYCSQETLSGQEVKKTYMTKGQITSGDYLLEGYKYKFLKNYSPAPSFLNWPLGLINPGIWNEIRLGNYDIVVLQSWTNLTWWIAFFACLIYKTPVFFMTDSNILSEVSKSNLKIKLKKIVMGKFLFKKASGFFTSGTTNEQFYRYYGVPEEKLIRVPFSWGYEWFLSQSEILKLQREKIRQDFGVKKGDFVLIYVGRLSWEKSLPLFLKAYHNIKFTNKKLFIVGDGPMKSELEKEIEKMGIKDVYFMGFQSRKKMGTFYAAADAFVLPSKSETWGIVINEAMCFGLPIIVSNQVGSAVDLVKDNYNGFIFTSEDMDMLSDSIIKLMNLSQDERLLFGKRSGELIKKWISSIDPVWQIVNTIKVQKYKSSN